ncbi:MAG: hypothetical protein O7J95_16285 [Planctomycetota bacterium]|nr:hypothetical protein [Planctomycetota bacterium]
MGSEKIDTVLDDLRREEERLKDEIAEIKTQEQTLKKELERVHAGISALAGKSVRAKKSSASKKKLSVGRVVELATEILQESGPLAEEDLREKIAGRLDSEGISKSSLGAQLKKGLQDKKFASGVSGWKLGEHKVSAPSPLRMDPEPLELSHG